MLLVVRFQLSSPLLLLLLLYIDIHVQLFFIYNASEMQWIQTVHSIYAVAHYTIRVLQITCLNISESADWLAGEVAMM